MDTAVINRLIAMRRSCWVALLLWHAGRALSEGEVADLLGINRETARQQLRELVALGVAVRRSRYEGYELAASADFGERARLEPRTSADFDVLGNAASADFGERARLEPRTSAGTAALEDSTTTTSIKLIKQKEAVVPNAENMAALKEAGFTETKRIKRLSAQPWVTPAYVQSHKARLKDGDSLGLALMRMENQEPGAPVKLTAEEERESFFSGPFADFIER